MGNQVLKNEAKIQLNSKYGKHATTINSYVDTDSIRETKIKIGVTITTASKTQYDHKYIETDTLLAATRIVNTYKPKRSHKIVKVQFEEVGVLV